MRQSKRHVIPDPTGCLESSLSPTQCFTQFFANCYAGEPIAIFQMLLIFFRQSKIRCQIPDSR